MLKKTLILFMTTAILLPLEAVEAGDRSNKKRVERNKPAAANKASKARQTKPRKTKAPSARSSSASKPKYTPPTRERSTSREADSNKARVADKPKNIRDLANRTASKGGENPRKQVSGRSKANERASTRGTVRRAAPDKTSKTASSNSADARLRAMQQQRSVARQAHRERVKERGTTVRAYNPAANVRATNRTVKQVAPDQVGTRTRQTTRSYTSTNSAVVVSSPRRQGVDVDYSRRGGRRGYEDGQRPGRHGDIYPPNSRGEHRYDGGRDSHRYDDRSGSHQRWHNSYARNHKRYKPWHYGRRHSDWTFYIGFGHYWGGWGLGYSAGYYSGWYDRYRYGYWFGPQYDFFGHWPVTSGYYHYRSHWAWHHHHHHYHYGDYCPNSYHGFDNTYGYYHSSSDDDGGDVIASALLGGIVGGIIGAEIDGGRNKTAGAVIGAAVGATAAAAAASDNNSPAPNRHFEKDVWDENGRHINERETYKPPKEIRTCMRYEDVNGNYICTKWQVEYVYDD